MCVYDLILLFDFVEICVFESVFDGIGFVGDFVFERYKGVGFFYVFVCELRFVGFFVLNVFEVLN